MPELTAILLILIGAVLLFAGGALSVYGVALLGMVLGGGAGYLLAPSISPVLGLAGPAALALPLVVGAIAGIAIAYVMLSFAAAALSLIVGLFIGWTVIAPALDPSGWLHAWGAALAVAILAGFLGVVLTKTTLIIVTSFVGAALASRSLTPAEFAAAQEAVTIQPLLFDVYSLIFLALFAIGVAAQFGLFKLGYALKPLTVLPGARHLTNRSRKTKTETQP